MWGLFLRLLAGYFWFIIEAMKMSQLFTKVSKETPKDEVSKNAQLLVRAGFVYKEMSGVYSFLPLGLRVIEKIKNIIREELNKVGGQEIFMTTLQKKDVWEATGRWYDAVVDDWFKTKLKNDVELGLAFTHEEPLTNIMKSFISSYKDLPRYVYQFQTKFRNELRAKSGLMRGREFVMKDLYDFSRDQKEHKAFYEKMKDVYMKIFTRVGIGDQTYLTISSGGSFSKYSFEFQTITEAGEDTILFDDKKKIAINKTDYSEELLKDFDLNKDDLNLKETRAVEVGDIYSLGEKYSKALGLVYTDKNGEKKPVFMGSYGIGVPRLMGTIVEVFNDERGIIWPEVVAPYKVIIVELSSKDEDKNKEIHKTSEKIYQDLQDAGVEVIYDDREDKSPGEKFAEVDLMGISWRVVISEKTLAEDKIELKNRKEKDVKLINSSKLLDEIL